MLSITIRFARIIALLAIANSAVATSLELEIFVAEPEEINVTSALIKGPTEMMVVCAQGTKSSANRLADAIEATGLKLKYVFLTHPHLDHSQGAGILLQRFPGAKFVASPKVAQLQRHRMKLDDDMAANRYGDNAAIPSIPAEDYPEKTLLIDDMPVEIWTDQVGDAGIGDPYESHSVLYVPSIHALIPSDIIYLNAHVMMGGSTSESRRDWVKQINGWIAQDFDVVVPGHMPKGTHLTAVKALQHTRDYITSYDQAISESETADEVIEKMLSLYPEMPHQSALYLGTFINFGQMHRLTFNPTVEKIAALLPESLVQWLNKKIFEAKKEQYNLDHSHF